MFSFTVCTYHLITSSISPSFHGSRSRDDSVGERVLDVHAPILSERLCHARPDPTTTRPRVHESRPKTRHDVVLVTGEMHVEHVGVASRKWAEEPREEAVGLDVSVWKVEPVV